MLWVGKVGLKDGLEWPSSATEPSPIGSMAPGAGQVKTQMNTKVGQSVLHHGAKYTHTTCPSNKTPTTCNNGQVEPVEADNKAASSVALSSAVAPPPCTGRAPVTSYSAFPKGTKGSPFGAGSIASPHVTCSPTSSIWTSLGGTPTPGPHWTPDLAHARSASPPQPSFAVALVSTAARAA